MSYGSLCRLRTEKISRNRILDYASIPTVAKIHERDNLYHHDL